MYYQFAAVVVYFCYFIIFTDLLVATCKRIVCVRPLETLALPTIAVCLCVPSQLDEMRWALNLSKLVNLKLPSAPGNHLPVQQLEHKQARSQQVFWRGRLRFWIEHSNTSVRINHFMKNRLERGKVFMLMLLLLLLFDGRFYFEFRCEFRLAIWSRESR